MQAARRTVQVAVWILIIAVPMVNLYGIKVQQRDEAFVEKSVLLSALHTLFKGGDRKEVVELTHTVRGSVWTLDVGGYKISDPLALVESTVTSMSLYLPLLLSVLIPVLLTLLLGRVYCGWLCPMSLLLEINDRLRSLLEKLGYPALDAKFHGRMKFGVLGGGLLMAYLVGMPVLSLVYPPAVISRELFYRTYNGVWGNGLLFLGLILFIELILSRRWWCRYVCPGGAVYVGLSRFRLLRISRDGRRCEQCGECGPVCPYDLQPMTQELGPDCDQCGLCISACKPGALAYGVKR